MSITAWALDRTRVIWVVLALLAGMGALAYQGLPRNNMPEFTIRFAALVTQFPGASPERVESLVTDPLEEVVQEIAEVKSISSESRTGLSIITVELRQDVPEKLLQGVWDRLRRKIEDKARTLPSGTKPPDLQDDGLGQVYGIVVGLQNDGFSYDELEDYAEIVRDKILTLEDASEVKIGGAQIPTIYIDYSPVKLAELGLNAQSLQQSLAATNILFPGGSVILGDERVILEPSGNFTTLAKLRATLISLPRGGSIALEDIAEVTRAYKSPATSLVRIDGKPGITLSISVRDGANLIRLGEAVDKLMAEEETKLPIGINVFTVADQDKVVAKSVSDFIGNLLQSVGVVFAVMLLMLGLRTGLVVASLIPMTILLTLFFMGAIGQGLNQVTLAALIMALGMLVDNAIVISEAIVVEMEGGAPPKKAAITATRELMMPLFISSLTTSAAFLAFFLAESLMGDIVGPLFIVITIALLGSWFLAMTLVPLLAVAFIRPKVSDKESVVMGGIRKGYSFFLALCLRYRAAVVVVILVLFVVVMRSAGSLPFIFFPDSDRALVQVEVNLPLGSRIESTDRAVAALEQHIATELSEEVINVSSFIGLGPESYDQGYQPGQGNSAYAHLLVNTSSGEVNQRVIDVINAFGIENLPNAEVKARRLAGGGGGVPIELRISGPSPAELYRIGERMKKFLQETPGSTGVSDSWGPRLKKFAVNIRQNDLRRAGLTNQDVAVSLQTVLTGFQTGEFRESDRSIPITMRAADATEFHVEDIQTIAIVSPITGKSIPLSQVASVDLDWQYPRIRRRNLSRMLSITSYLEGGFTANDLSVPLVTFIEEDKKSWPDGYTYELGGEAEQSEEGMGSIIEKLPIAGAIIILLLVFQFNSIRKSVIVLATIPLGVIGVILGLHAFQSYFGFFGFLGIISLAGIVINNAIVLLDRIRLEIEDRGLDPNQAIVVACNHRLRPILLTTLTTTLGLLPLYLGGGAMWEPMAVSIMAGLMFATLITLVFVPVLYSLLFRTKKGTVSS
ncbi:MAG: efflux RND transporter permease subunit [Kofleriaceae bacterium]|nr:efflux RND transporter permease subunit [Kofleriaceae bacterium]